MSACRAMSVRTAASWSSARVTSDDAINADWLRLPYDLLEQIASRMINELRDVNRVALDITCEPPGTIEWEQGSRAFARRAR